MPEYARALKRRQGRLGDIWRLDEVFIKINAELHYFWRVVDHQDGDTKRFFRKLLKSQNEPRRRVITDKLKSYSAAHREVLPSVIHSTEQHENNRAEVSQEPTRQRERQMRRFKSAEQAQRFLTVYGVVGNLFGLG